MALHVFKLVKDLQILGECKWELGGNHTAVFHFHNQSYLKYKEYLWVMLISDTWIKETYRSLQAVWFLANVSSLK